jgi:hypothetical protein
MAALERTIVHYSTSKLAALKSDTLDQAKLAVIHGKPTGFWYAYGTNWKNIVNSGKAGRNTSTTAFRYEFRLPESAFITNVAAVSRDSILELSQSNLDAFMKKYAKDKYRYSATNLLERAFTLFMMDGESAVLSEISNMDEEFADFCDRLMDLNGFDPKKVAKKVNTTFPHIISEFAPSKEALASDQMLTYDWTSFWADVSKTLGGVEFHADLFATDAWGDIALPWTSKLDIRSGVIFHPATFRNGVLTEQLRATVLGGRRRTRRKGRKTT